MNEPRKKQPGGVTTIRKAFPLICVFAASWVVFHSMGGALPSQPGAIGIHGGESHPVSSAKDSDAAMPAASQPASRTDDLGFPALPSP